VVRLGLKGEMGS